MAEPRSGAVRYLLAGAFRSMAYVEWGDPAAPPVICVHGLTRNGRDFDALAQALAPAATASSARTCQAAARPTGCPTPTCISRRTTSRR